MNPFVSVVITTYNQESFIEATVQSVLDQTYAHREILVVDDGSTDSTPARMAAFGDRIIYIRQSNQGVAESRNTGVRHARGQLLAFLDGDDIWEREKLAVQVDLYRQFPHAGLFVVDARSFSGSNVIEPSTLRFAADEFILSQTGDTFCLPSYRALLPHNFIMTTSQVMIPAAVLSQIGPSDRSLRIASDYDLYLRIAKHHDVAYTKRDPDQLAVCADQCLGTGRIATVSLPGGRAALHSQAVERRPARYSRRHSRNDADEKLADGTGRLLLRVDDGSALCETLSSRKWMGRQSSQPVAVLLLVRSPVSAQGTGCDQGDDENAVFRTTTALSGRDVRPVLFHGHRSGLVIRRRAGRQTVAIHAGQSACVGHDDAARNALSSVRLVPRACSASGWCRRPAGRRSAATCSSGLRSTHRCRGRRVCRRCRR